MNFKLAAKKAKYVRESGKWTIRTNMYKMRLWWEGVWLR